MDYVFETYQARYHEAWAQFEGANDEIAAMASCKAMLEDKDCPGFWRFKAQVLLGECQNNVGDAENCYDKAEKMLEELVSHGLSQEMAEDGQQDLAGLKKSIEDYLKEDSNNALANFFREGEDPAGEEKEGLSAGEGSADTE